MTATRVLRRLASRAARGLRRLTGRQADIDYRRWYSTWDLQRDYWTIVGPATKEEYHRLSIVKLQLLIDLGLTPDSRIFDVGCGTGLLAAALHDFLGERGLYAGADISSEAIGFCRSRFPRPNFSFHVSEMTQLPALTERFDFIVFYSVFTHTYPQETALLLREASRLLADGGIIFADVFTAPLIDECSGDRGAVEINPDYLMRLLEGSGLHAELIEIQPRPRLGQRLFFKFTRESEGEDTTDPIIPSTR
ncbi:MAG TPA: class I SAM-dependent methyltransferase [Gemmataceae bacterium]|nr:class I SAM-dependent methyltransferase [Gemmataceae bacterium]